jgi:F-type H+-transporting ATPase subunit b
MKNWAIVFLLSSLLAGLALAQEGHSTPTPSHEAPAAAAAEGGHAAAAGGESHEGAKHEESGDPYIMWKWINFGILALGLGYLIAQNLPPFFASRTAEIQKGIAEATKLKAEADAKAAQMEQRMAKLSTEIESLRAHGKAELATEGDRIRKETEALVAKIQAGAEAEIESTAKAARQELKSYSAQLALELAEKRIGSRIAAGSDTLVPKFIRDLERKGVNN